MAAEDEIIKIACDLQPELATLVPEKREELTTEGGLNVLDNIDKIGSAIERLHEYDIPVSLFLEPDINQIDASAEISADVIEIHTGNYANAPTEEDMVEELDRITEAASHAKKLGLGVNAGHGLNYINMKDFINVPNIDEVSIGHALVVESLLNGFEDTIKKYVAICKP